MQSSQSVLISSYSFETGATLQWIKTYVHHVTGALKIVHAPDRVVFEGEGGQVHHAGEAVDDAALARRLVNEHPEQRMEDVLLVVRLALRVKRTWKTRNSEVRVETDELGTKNPSI